MAYDIDKILRAATEVDIAPDRKDWSILCCAMKVLGYDETSFVAISQPYGTSEGKALRKWREERGFARYFTLTSDEQRKLRALSEATARERGKLRLRRLCIELAATSDLRTSEGIRQRIAEELAKGWIVALAKRSPNFKNRMESFWIGGEWHNANSPRITPSGNLPERPEPQKRPLNPRLVERMEANVGETSLFAFMEKEWGAEATKGVLAEYHVGGSGKYLESHGLRANVFPYINREGLVVDCKLLHVNPESGSRHNADPLYFKRNGEPTSTAMALGLVDYGKHSDRRLPWCNFGDHLLNANPSASIGVVESEKTAIFARLSFPEKVWVAVGSLSNLTSERFRPYRGRKIVLYPDKKGVDKWREIGRGLASEGFNISVNSAALNYEGEDTDLADIILLHRHGQLKPVQPLPSPEPPDPQPSAHGVITTYPTAKGGNETETPTGPRKIVAVKSPDLMEAEAIWERMKRENPSLDEMEIMLDLEVIGFVS